MKNRKNKFIQIFISLAFFLFLFFPIIWIFFVSIQPGDVAYSGHYRFFPQTFTLEAYSQTFLNSLLYSSLISGISAAFSMFFATLAIYLIKSEIISEQWQMRIFKGAVGLFFLPAFVVILGLKNIEYFFHLTLNPTFKLFVVHSIFGFVMAFILLLFVYSSSQHSYFEQLLLETGTRLRAFYYGIVLPHFTGTLIVCAFTFATIWSEFFLSGLITTTQKIKPFSVVLQMAQGQYGTQYSVFAAGAILSLLFWIAALAVISIIGFAVHYITTQKEGHENAI